MSEIEPGPGIIWAVRQISPKVINGRLLLAEFLMRLGHAEQGVMRVRGNVERPRKGDLGIGAIPARQLGITELDGQLRQRRRDLQSLSEDVGRLVIAPDQDQQITELIERRGIGGISLDRELEPANRILVAADLTQRDRLSWSPDAASSDAIASPARPCMVNAQPRTYNAPAWCGSALRSLAAIRSASSGRSSSSADIACASRSSSQPSPSASPGCEGPFAAIVNLPPGQANSGPLAPHWPRVDDATCSHRGRLWQARSDACRARRPCLGRGR
jgi:hypothetical protein